MAKVKAITLQGYELFFYPKDHEPEHFHFLELGNSWEIKILFMLCTRFHLETRPKRPAWWTNNYSPLPKHKKKQLLQAICKHRIELKAEWDKLQGE